MSAERFVVVGLAHVRATWFAEVSRWSTSGLLPIEFVKCVSIDEVRSHVASGRAVSALLLDAGRTGVDRDLLDDARTAGTAVIVIGDERRNWVELGAAAQLPATFGRAELVELLRRHATPIGRADAIDEPLAAVVDGGWRGRLVAVTGPGGTGTSTLAMALAQSLGADARNLGLVVLADLALDADLAMYHDARDVVPGVQELTDGFRSGTLDPDAVRAMTFEVTDRRYHLLLGLRNHRDWTAIRPRSFDAALDALRRAFRVVVADLDDDVEGQERTGSLDVEERNVFARRCTRQADVVLVVGLPDTKGVHALVRTVHRLLDHGVDARRIVPVLNRAGRSPRRRAEIAQAYAQLLGDRHEHALAAPVFVGERRGLDDLVSQAAPMPASLARTIGASVDALLDHALAEHEPVAPSATSRSSGEEPERIVPGSLGSWSDLDDEDGTGTGGQVAG